jgi:hypothetical protein
MEGFNIGRDNLDGRIRDLGGVFNIGYHDGMFHNVVHAPKEEEYMNGYIEGAAEDVMNDDVPQFPDSEIYMNAWWKYRGYDDCCSSKIEYPTHEDNDMYMYGWLKWEGETDMTNLCISRHPHHDGYTKGRTDTLDMMKSLVDKGYKVYSDKYYVMQGFYDHYDANMDEPQMVVNVQYMIGWNNQLNN